MHHTQDRSTALELIGHIDALHAHVSGIQRDLFRLIAEVDRREVWRDSGARDTAHWLSIRYGISDWKARRWIAAAHALEGLPRVAEAFARGQLGIDKVVELTRFATPGTEGRLIEWAQRVSCGRIRERGDAEARRSLDDARRAHEDRSLTGWLFDEGTRFALHVELPAAEGVAVMKAVDRQAARLPVIPGEEGTDRLPARRADALVALATGRIAEDADPDRASIVIHAPLKALLAAEGGCEIEGGGVIHAEIARRLLCNARVQTVIEGEGGEPLGFGRTTRVPSAAMMRQIRYRDRECTFPGCGARRFTEAHHIVWWSRGGRTDLDHMALICSFHHRLVHEYGWSMRGKAGRVEWFRPDGRRFLPGPAPPDDRLERPPPVPSGLHLDALATAS